MLVGAPIAENQEQGLKSGTVYKCKLSTNKNDCVPLRIEADEKKSILMQLKIINGLVLLLNLKVQVVM